ncbi:MAG TPA: hypothetical protein VFV23_10445 [Verrucomicrobiae bacterium]|nr:hypothetical protein [Verrucomicrobiae bacterium]
MPYDQARRKMIRDCMKEQEDHAGGKDKLPQEKLVVQGRAQREPVYRMRLEDLAFNKANGRIKAEVLEKEAELGRFLEPSSRDDQEIINKMLLEIRPDENEKISEDLKKYGQQRPGIITCDGILINGNRRKAILGELAKAHGDKFKYMDVQVLPSDISKSELWLIEAGIQLSTPQQLDYSPINHLLKLREGIDSGLDIAEMSARIYGVSKEKIESDLARLDLIDEYLSDFLEKPNCYYLVKQLSEHFINLQNILSWADKPRGVPMNWKPDKSDRTELKLVAFYYIRLRFPHLRIRELRDLFATEESWNEVKRALEIDAQLTEEEKEALGLGENAKEKEVEPIDENGSDVGADTSTFRTTAEDKDIQEEACWREKHSENLKSFYEDAKEQKQIVKDSQRPLALAKRALNMIKAIPLDRKKLTEPEIDDVLHDIILSTNELRKLLQKQRVKKNRPQK